MINDTASWEQSRKKKEEALYIYCIWEKVDGGDDSRANEKKKKKVKWNEA